MILFENWNRYYDPLLGRYLQPEPLLAAPNFVAGDAALGFSMPAYAYARSNPLKFTDPTGLYSWIDSCTTTGGGVSATYGEDGSDAWTFRPTGSTIQLNTGADSACVDLKLAQEAYGLLRKEGKTGYNDCWERLLRTIRRVCYGFPERPPTIPDPNGPTACK